MRGWIDEMEFSVRNIHGSLVKVVVDRKQWVRGGGSSSLRNDRGLMCRLGFACLTLGYSQSEIKGHSYPSCLGDQQKLLPQLRRRIDSGYGYSINNMTGAPPIQKAAIINDESSITDKERERLLIELAPQLGLEFEFIN